MTHADLGWDNWTVEPMSATSAFLVNPHGGRVAVMSRARANGIAAALNTSEGGQAFASGRLHRTYERGQSGRADA